MRVFGGVGSISAMLSTGALCCIWVLGLDLAKLLSKFAARLQITSQKLMVLPVKRGGGLSRLWRWLTSGHGPLVHLGEQSSICFWGPGRPAGCARRRPTHCGGRNSVQVFFGPLFAGRHPASLLCFRVLVRWLRLGCLSFCRSGTLRSCEMPALRLRRPTLSPSREAGADRLSRPHRRHRRDLAALK